MKLTIAGSLGNISKLLTAQLVEQGHDVTVISSNQGRAAEIEALGARPAIGSVTDPAFLASAFRNTDAVYTMTPPNLGGVNVLANTAAAGKAYAEAITTTGVKKVVMLSSIGAHLPSGNGPIAGLHKVEEIYRKLEGVDVTFIRAGFFYTNFYQSIPVIKGMNIMGNNFSGETDMAMVHPADIADAIASELLSAKPGTRIRYVVSDRRKAREVASILGHAIGKTGLPWVQFSDAQLKEGMLQAGMPGEIADLYVEMGNGLGNGSIEEHFLSSGATLDGKRKLEDFAKEFALRF